MLKGRIQAKETCYRGVLFRSRLEARWAVFFDALKVSWQYEPRRFFFPDGTSYLPDFYLPNWNDSYIEIKGSDHNIEDEDYKKMGHFCKERSLFLFIGDIPEDTEVREMWSAKFGGVRGGDFSQHKPLPEFIHKDDPFDSPFIPTACTACGATGCTLNGTINGIVHRNGCLFLTWNTAWGAVPLMERFLDKARLLSAYARARRKRTWH